MPARDPRTRATPAAARATPRGRSSGLGALCRTVDGSSLAVLRIAFGLAMVAQGLRYRAKGWIAEHYVEPDLHFTYPGFGWVRPLPGQGIHVEFAAMVALAALLTVGRFTRTAAALLSVTTAHWLLIDKTYYNNHYYLQALLALLLAVVPSARAWSLDARRGPQADARVPLWSVALLRFQLAVVYVYGGIAKLDRSF